MPKKKSAKNKVVNSTECPLIHANSLLVAHPTEDWIAVVDGRKATKILPWFQGDVGAIPQWWTQLGGSLERECAWLYGDLVLGPQDLWLQTWILESESAFLPTGWMWSNWDELLKNTPNGYKNYALNLHHAWKKYLLSNDLAILTV